MHPCPECQRHVRSHEVQCPFCSADLPSSRAFAAIGPALVSALMMLGATACSGDTVSAESGNTTTTNSSTNDSVADTSDGAMTDTETDTDDSPDDSPTTSGSFYAGPEPDWGEGPSWCDPFAQDCPEGEKCVPYSYSGGTWDANKCVPIVGDGQPGEPCTYGGTIEAIDDCDGSGMCWNVVEIEGELVGTCTAFCTGTPDNPQCDGDASCLIANQGSITLCIDSCDPQAQDCPDGQVCGWSGSGYTCLPDAPPGQSCEASECPANSLCVQGQLLPECESSACCAQYCSVSQPMCDQPGTVCVPLYDRDPPPGAEDVGVCLLPE
jgi:hypothetical protein